MRRLEAIFDRLQIPSNMHVTLAFNKLTVIYCVPNTKELATY